LSKDSLILSISTLSEELRAALLISLDLSAVTDPYNTESSSLVSFTFYNLISFSSSFDFSFSNFVILDVCFFKGLS